MNVLPTAKQLDALPTLATAQSCDLKIDTGDYRVWLSRCGLDDGEPYENTVYIEELDSLIDSRGWYDLGHYDGDDPPRGLAGVTAHAFRGEII